MRMNLWGLALVVSVTVPAWGISGDPNDIYVLSDATSDVLQYERNNPWNYVPGTHTSGSLGGGYSQVFSNSTQLSSNAPYLGAAAGPNDNLFVGGFNGLIEIDGVSGNQVLSVAGGTRLGPAKAPNGNIVVGGPTGVEEFNSTTGAFVRTVNNAGNGSNLHAFRGNEMFVATWSTGANAFGVQRYDFTTGLTTNPTIPVPFGVQEIGFGPDGALYATALYEGPGVEGMWRYNEGLGTWSHFIDTQALPGGGPHGFAYDPVNFDLFLAFNTGEIHRFNGLSGAFLNTIDTVPTKLTDILFHQVVPEPTTMTLLAAGAVLAMRRRRRA